MEWNAGADSSRTVSPWWRYSLFLVVVIGMSILVFISAKAYKDAPPIPDGVVDSTGRMVFTGKDILAGQNVFLKYALMENGTIWGHGAYLGPDFSAEYLHTLGVDVGEAVSKRLFNRETAALTQTQRNVVNAEVEQMLKVNRYEPKTKTLIFSLPEAESYQKQIKKWTDYFSGPTVNGGLPFKYISDPKEIRELTSFLPGRLGLPPRGVPANSTPARTTFPTIRQLVTDPPVMPISGACSVSSCCLEERPWCCLLSGDTIILAGRGKAKSHAP